METLSPHGLLTFDLLDPTLSAERAASFHETRPFDAIVAVDEESAVVAAAVGRHLGLAHNPPAAAARARSKHRMRRALSEAGVPSPGYQVLEAKDDPRPVAKTTSYPAIVKPVFLSGSRGVVRVDDEQELLERTAWLRDLLSTPELVKRGGEDAGRILVEDFVPGFEVAVEGILTASAMSPLANFRQARPHGRSLLRGDDLRNAVAAATSVSAGDPGRDGPSCPRPGVDARCGPCGASVADGRRSRRDRGCGSLHRRALLPDASLWFGRVARRADPAACARRGRGSDRARLGRVRSDDDPDSSRRGSSRGDTRPRAGARDRGYCRGHDDRPRRTAPGAAFPKVRAIWASFSPVRLYRSKSKTRYGMLTERSSSTSRAHSKGYGRSRDRSYP